MTRSNLARLCLGVCAALLAALPGTSSAQDKYPSRAIRLVIPFAPGGGTDLTARRFAARLGPAIGRNLIPDNRGGGGGTVGTAEAARAAPDGYTLLIGVPSTLAINPWAMRNPPYDADKDFVPIVVVGTVPMAIVVHPALGSSLKQFIAYAKAHPGKLSYGSGGVGSINHLTAELFKKEAGGLNIVHVPYKGAGPAVYDVIAGQIPMVAATFSAMISHHRSGKARMLAIATERRSKAAPEIPTAVEQGLPGMIAGTWQALLAPAGTPKAVIDVLYQASHAILNTESFQKELEALAIEPVVESNPETAARFIQQERARWGPIIKNSGFQLD